MRTSFSKKFEISTYDLWGSARDAALFVLAGLVTNIDVVHQQLLDWGVSTFFATLIIWYTLDLGRRFLRDYAKESGKE